MVLGEPAVGKSTIMSEILQGSVPVEFKVNGRVIKARGVGKIIALGVYDGAVNDGTDRLAMNIQPFAIKLLNNLEKTPFKDYTVIIEGDRLGNMKFIEALKERPAVVIIKASEKNKSQRHKDRKDSQGETFLKSRKTKYKNIEKALYEKLIPFLVFNNDVPEDVRCIASQITEIAGGLNAVL